MESRKVNINNQKFFLIRPIGNGWYYAYTDIIFKMLKEYSDKNIFKGLEETNFFKRKNDNRLIYSSKYDIENIKILPMGFGLVRPKKY